jgi:hypothetical protein
MLKSGARRVGYDLIHRRTPAGLINDAETLALNFGVVGRVIRAATFRRSLFVSKNHRSWEANADLNIQE